MRSKKPAMHYIIKFLNAVNLIFLLMMLLFLMVFPLDNGGHIISPTIFDLIFEKWQTISRIFYPILFGAVFAISKFTYKKNNIKISLIIALIPITVYVVAGIIEYCYHLFL